MRLVFVLVFSAMALVAGDSTLAADSINEKPNILLILADDLGYMDIGANNPRTFYETPNIDRLARSGMRFTRGYAACCVCSPTRGSIMTGKYPPRFGVTDFIPGMRSARLRSAPNALHLPLAETTVAEALRDGGYTTFFAGKWHLGGGDYYPGAQGFPQDLTPAGGNLANAQFWYPRSTPPTNPKDDPKTTDRIADAAVKFIESHKDQPFFAYLPFLSVHIPIGARADLVAKYERKRLSASPDAWGEERSSKVRLAQNNAVYAAMLEQLDAGVGRVLAALERNNLVDRTIVVFMADNGGLSTAEGHPTSNLPLRGGKGWPYEGGVREPWIVRAPGVTKPGGVCDTPVISTDFYPTLLALAGLPTRPEQHLDGVSLVPLLKGQPFQRGKPLFWHYPHYGNQGGAPHGAIRDGDWKLIEWYEDGALELYDLARDPGEKDNLAARHPDTAKKLHAKLASWREEVGAIMPTPNPAYHPEAKPASPSPRKAAGTVVRPNILFLFADDMRADAIAALGNPIVKTPNLDRLARGGLVFDRAYMQGGMQGATCVPSRAMLLSGRCLFHVDERMKRDETWPEAFARSGYETFVSGKWHNGADSLVRSFQGARSVFLGGMTDPMRARLSDVVEGKVTPAKPASRHACEVFADQAIRFLNAPRTAPFLCYIPFDAPHDPHIVPAEFPVHYDPGAIPLPASFSPIHPFDNGEMTIRDERLLPWPRTPEGIRGMLAEYYRYISYLDSQIGRVLDALDAQPFAKDTIVVFAADSGVARGSHGLIGKQNLYEFDSIRVPLIIGGPGIPRGGRTEAMCYLFDVLPTLGKLAGVEPPATSEGVEFSATLRDPSRQARGEMLFAYRDLQRAYRDGRWKLIRYPQVGKDQLFDLKLDPQEIVNLAERPQYAGKVAELTSSLGKLQRQFGDPAPLTVAHPRPAEWTPPPESSSR